jgi:RNA polymerase sigma-70 factor, ECF subfamily
VDALTGAELEAWFGLPLLEAIDYAFRFAYRLTGQREDAEDLMQEGLMRLIARRERGVLPPVDNPMSYLYTIIRNLHRDSVRRPRPVALPESHSETLPETDPGPDDLAVLTMRRDSVTSALARLSHDHRMVIRLVIFEGMSRREASRALSIPEETVKSRLHAAKAQLRGSLWSEEKS